MAAYTTVDNPELYFQTVLWTGNAITDTAITGVGFQPDMTWIKERSQVRSHVLFDVVRGATVQLNPNDSASDATVAESLQSFDADGFTVGTETSVNQSGETYVAWCWKETADAGFDIVSYTGNGTDDTDISHNLSAVPKMIIVKNRDATDDWQIYHGANTSAPETDYMVLNESDATADNADRWSDEAPTSSVFTLGDADEVNTDTENYIAYCFAEKQGFSKFGSYVGANSGADGPFIYTGFKPAFILIKNTTSAANWHIRDNKRSTYNPSINFLMPDSYVAEVTAGEAIDILSNGFKIKANGLKVQDSGNVYIYMAFAEAPFVNSNGVPCNAR